MSRRTRRFALVPLAVSTVLLAACSSSSSPGASGPTTTTAGATAASTTTSLSGTAPTPAGKALARYATYRSQNYDLPGHWVCRPDTPHDICHGDLDSTTIAADGTLTVEKFHAAPNPPIDCFYVYPTISRDQSNYSDWNASPGEEGYVTLNQAARLASQCRVFAPVYRQGTLAGLASRLGTGGSKFTDTGNPFADVLDAFRTYMAEDNHGRGFVLIGHSQGAGMVNQLVRTEIDPNADVRAKLVAAYVAGATIAVPTGKVVGGDFKHIPLCTKAAESGCALAWSTFRSTAPPPPSSFFARVSGRPGETASCVNPAAPAGGSAAAHSYFPANAKASILSALGAARGGKSWLKPGASGSITTPYVSVPGLVTVACVDSGGFQYLQATVHPDPTGKRADNIPGDLTPQWGLHLVDVNLVMGDIVTLVGEQAKAYAG